MRGQRRLHPLRITSQHSTHLGETQAQRAQGRDFRTSRHLGGTVSSPTGSGADRFDQALSFVKAQRLGRNAEPSGAVVVPMRRR